MSRSCPVTRRAWQAPRRTDRMWKSSDSRSSIHNRMSLLAGLLGIGRPTALTVLPSSSMFRLGQRDVLAQSQQVRFGLEDLRLRGVLRTIERAFGACHPVRALLEEIV